jgi:ATP-dependent RNA helicase SUPV3L1/SUV3
VVTKIVKELGEELEVTNANRELYSPRLSPLTITKPLQRSFANIQPKDCLLTFSRNGIYRMMAMIPKRFNTYIIYGSLPPSTRAEQARQFNADPNGVLIASNAVGMGLNLHIQRMVFMEMERFNGKRMMMIDASECRQIGGRAGRGVDGAGQVTT